MPYLSLADCLHALSLLSSTHFFSLTVFSPCSFAFWPLLLVADWDRICCQRWEDKTDLYHKRQTKHILNNNIQTSWRAFTYTARWHTQSRIAKKKSAIINPSSLWLGFIFFLRLCLLLFFDCLPASCFLWEDTRLELGDWGIWSIPLAGWGGLKKKKKKKKKKRKGGGGGGGKGGGETVPPPGGGGGGGDRDTVGHCLR